MVMADLLVGGVIAVIIILAAFVAVHEHRKGNTCGNCGRCSKVNVIQIDDGEERD